VLLIDGPVEVYFFVIENTVERKVFRSTGASRLGTFSRHVTNLNIKLMGPAMNTDDG
jgi:hypothetical protein